jgi:hypothetical protein
LKTWPQKTAETEAKIAAVEERKTMLQRKREALVRRKIEAGRSVVRDSKTNPAVLLDVREAA